MNTDFKSQCFLYKSRAMRLLQI